MALAELEDLSEAVRLAAKVDYTVLSGVEVESAAEMVQRLKAQLAGLEAQAVGAYDASMQWLVSAHRSAASALRHRCRIFGGGAGTAVSLARALRTMPGTQLALHDGAVSFNHARRPAQASTRPEFADAEAFLLSKAATLSYADFQRAVAYWEQVVDDARRGDDPEPPDPKETKRAAHVSQTLSEMTRVDAWLEPVGGETFREALRLIEQEMFKKDWEKAKAGFGDAVAVDRLWRTPAQRRADALVEMAVRSRTAPKNGKRPLPLIIIHTNLDTFEAALARLTPKAAHGAERLCETDGGVVLTPTQMIEQAIQGHVCRLVYQSPGVILDYGRKQRLFTGELRQTIQARDRRCAHDGCDIPARQCEIDHDLPWDDHGRTAHYNGKARCSYHHRNWKPRPG